MILIALSSFGDEKKLKAHEVVLNFLLYPLFSANGYKKGAWKTLSFNTHIL